jgi:6,7-dimethyl-8-ribityllumazine synthase
MSTADAKLPAVPPMDGPAPHLLVVRAPYYVEVVDGLRDGAARLLRAAGADFDVLDVAGALELAGAVRLAVRGSRRFDGYVVLGCVVRGDTDHYEYVCREAMAGLTQVVQQFGLCLGNGLLTVDLLEQAIDRSLSPEGGANGHNKGAEAAAAALLQIRAARWLGAG